MKIQIKFMDMEAKVQNKREEKLVNIVNDQIERIVEYWNDQDWRINFEGRRGNHWLVQEVDGLLTAMFYMGMVSEPTCGTDVFEATKRAWQEGVRSEEEAA